MYEAGQRVRITRYWSAAFPMDAVFTLSHRTSVGSKYWVFVELLERYPNHNMGEDSFTLHHDQGALQTPQDYKDSNTPRNGEPAMLLSTDAAARKGMPICTGVVDYFPRALAAVAACSKKGNDQHNPGKPLHWAKEKSTDHADCIMRHLIDRNALDTDGEYHATKLAWRALANLEIFLEGKEQANAIQS